MMGEARKRGAGAGPAKAGRPDGAGEGGEKPQVHFRKALRNPNINYRSGWWAVSIQVAKNKSLFGVIVGVKAVLNALGAAVEAYWRALPLKYPEFWGTSPAKGLKNKGFLGPCPHRIPTGYMLLPAPDRLAHYHRIYINAVVCHIHRTKVASPSEVDRVVTPRAKFMV